MKLTEFTVYTTIAGTDLLAGCFIEAGIDEYVVYEGRENIQDFLNDCAENWDYADIDKIAPDDIPSIETYIPNVKENEGKTEKLKSLIYKFAEENKDIDLSPLKIEIKTIEEQDWANMWKEFYKPTAIGERLMICPSWEKDIPELGGRKLLLLDPGLAFGSGLHETTRMCLEQIEKTADNGKTVIDLGCGSGILSIAAQLLGASEVKAVDIDPICTKVAKENAELNNVNLDTADGNVTDDEFFNQLICGKTDKYDIVLANIVANVLIKIAYRVPSLLKKGGVFISSGILNERLEEVLEEYKKQKIKILEVKSMGEWCCVVGTVD